MILYAHDILLIAPSIGELQRMLHDCENKLDWLDMYINEKNRVVSVLAQDPTLSVPI